MVTHRKKYLKKEAEDTSLGRLDTIRKNNQKIKVSAEEVEDYDTKQEAITNLFVNKVIELDGKTCSD